MKTIHTNSLILMFSLAVSGGCYSNNGHLCFSFNGGADCPDDLGETADEAGDTDEQTGLLCWRQGGVCIVDHTAAELHSMLDSEGWLALREHPTIEDSTVEDGTCLRPVGPKFACGALGLGPQDSWIGKVLNPTAPGADLFGPFECSLCEDELIAAGKLDPAQHVFPHTGSYLCHEPLFPSEGAVSPFGYIGWREEASPYTPHCPDGFFAPANDLLANWSFAVAPYCGGIGWSCQTLCSTDKDCNPVTQAFPEGEHVCTDYPVNQAFQPSACLINFGDDPVPLPEARGGLLLDLDYGCNGNVCWLSRDAWDEIQRDPLLLAGITVEIVDNDAVLVDVHPLSILHAVGFEDAFFVELSAAMRAHADMINTGNAILQVTKTSGVEQNISIRIIE